jgi:peptidyl-prolyl cis-trans isomerase C
MKIRFFLRNLTWLVAIVAALGLACEPQADVKPVTAPDTSKAPVKAVTEPAVEETSRAVAETIPEKKADITIEKAVEKPAEAAVEIPAQTEELTFDPDETAVTINGIAITEGQIEEQLKPQLAGVASRLPAELLSQYKKQIRQQTIEKIVVEQLLDEKVKANNIVITDEYVTTHLEQTGASQQPPLSLEDIKALIEARGQSFEQTKQRLKRGMAYEKLMEAQWGNQVSVTEQDARNYYETEDPNQFKQPEQATASHILIKPDTTDPNTDPNKAKEKARKKALQLLNQIRDGADFATLARANSDCPSASNGGDLGTFNRGRMVKAFEEAAFKLKVGQVSDIVETRFGYHIIKLTDRINAAVIPFEQIQNNIISMLEQQKMAEFAKQYVEQLKAKANIVYPPGKEPDTSAPAFPLAPAAP